ncbi:MAG TPA: glycosyltransferase family 1 protein [Thermomicrobiales bacterium]|nr:glycosyltransferase family 1 protein [Thermomicrobiales bacterium]
MYVSELRAALPAAADRIGVALDLVSLAPGGPLATRRRRLTWETAGVARALRRSMPRPDVVHIPHQMPPAIRAPRGLAEVVTVHDVIPWLLPEYRRTRVVQTRLILSRFWLHRAARVIVPSRATADDAARLLGIPRHRLALIPLAPSAGFTPPSTPDDFAGIRRVRQRYGIDGPYVFNVGGFDARKNLVTLVEGFGRALSTADPDSQPTLVIGGAPHSDNETVFPPLEPVIARLGLQRRVILTGKLPADDLLSLHRGAAVYCTPSIYEGFGLTPLDAMACGVPVVVANRTSLPEVTGDAGLLVEPTPAAVGEALGRVLRDDVLARRLHNRGLERAATFTWAATAEATIHAYLAATRQVTSGRK